MKRLKKKDVTPSKSDQKIHFKREAQISYVKRKNITTYPEDIRKIRFHELHSNKFENSGKMLKA